MATLDSEPHVLMLDCLAARRLGETAQNPGGHKSGALLPGRRDSQRFSISHLLFLQEFILVDVPYFSTCSFTEMSAHGKEKPISLLDMQHSRVCYSA